MPDLTSTQLLVEVVGLPGEQQLVVHQVAAVHLDDGELGRRERVVLARGEARRLPFDREVAPRSLTVLGDLLRVLQPVKPDRTEHRPRPAAGVALEVGALSENQKPPSRGEELAMTRKLTEAQVQILRVLDEHDDREMRLREVADALGVTVSTARKRLTVLSDEGLVDSRQKGFGRTAPSLWSLSLAGEEVLRCAS